MSGVYERMARTARGARALAAARLRKSANDKLHIALKKAGMSRSELASVLGVRKSAVTQIFNALAGGESHANLTLTTLAEYLDAMGFELELVLVNRGQLREDAVRDMWQTWQRRPDVEASVASNLDGLSWSDSNEVVGSILFAGRRDDRFLLSDGT